MSENKKLDIVSPQMSLCESFLACVACCTDWFSYFEFCGPQFDRGFESVQSYTLFCNPENSIFTDPETINSRVELFDTFAGTALQSDYNAWSYVNFCIKACFLCC